MNRLFNFLRGKVERPAEDWQEEAPSVFPTLPDFDNRLEVLFRYAEQAASYEDDLSDYLRQSGARLEALQARVDQALDAGKDRDAFEFVRLAARIRPQYELLRQEIDAFHSVANDLTRRVNVLFEHLEEARGLALDGSLNPAAVEQLDETMTRLTRYFVMLERVASARRRALPDRLAERMTMVLDDHALDLQLARYVLVRRRQIGPGRAGR